VGAGKRGIEGLGGRSPPRRLAREGVVGDAFLRRHGGLGIFDPHSLSKQPNLVQSAYFIGAFFVVLSAVLALWAGWLHGYDVLDEEEVWRLLTEDWGDDSEARKEVRI
jgi:hypothetical protein